MRTNVPTLAYIRDTLDKSNLIMELNWLQHSLVNEANDIPSNMRPLNIPGQPQLLKSIPSDMPFGDVEIYVGGGAWAPGLTGTIAITDPSNNVVVYPLNHQTDELIFNITLKKSMMPRGGNYQFEATFTDPTGNTYVTNVTTVAVAKIPLK
jgi:hypothetical protein